MKPKENGCYAITKAELLKAMRAGGVLRWLDGLGPYIDIGRYGRYKLPRECHPRRDTVRTLVREGVIVESDDASPVQKKCGLATYRIAKSA